MFDQWGSQTGTRPAAISSSSVSSVGKVSLKVSDLGGSALQSVGDLGAGYVGVAKGLVSLAENAPIVGGIAKPLIGFVGGIVDATIGRGFSALDTVRLGDKTITQQVQGGLEFLGTPLALGMDAISAPAKFAQERVAAARIESTAAGRKDFITSVFSEVPQGIVDSIRSGTSIEDAAVQLAASGKGFSENTAYNLLWSLALDPMNPISFGLGKAVSIGAKASEFALFMEKTGAEAISVARAANQTAEVARLVQAQEFVQKWGWTGKIYDATIGRLKGFTSKFAPRYAKAITETLYQVVPPPVIDDFLDHIPLFNGGSRAAAEDGLRSVAITAAGAMRSGLVKAASIIKINNAESFGKSAVALIEQQLRNGADAASVLSSKLDQMELSLSEIMTNSGIKLEAQNALVNTIKKEIFSNSTRTDELLRLESVQQFAKALGDGYASWIIKNKGKAIKSVARWRESLDARQAAEEAAKIFADSNAERLAAASNLAKGKPEFIQDLMSGFKMREGDATKMAEFYIEKYKGDIRKLANVMFIARSANYGKAVEGLALVRTRILAAVSKVSEDLKPEYEKYGRTTIISVRTITKDVIGSIQENVASLRSELASAESAGDIARATIIKDKLKAIADDLVLKYDDFAAYASKGDYGYNDVLDFLEKGKPAAAEVLSPEDVATIARLATTNGEFKALEALGKTLEGMGYRLGLAPESGVVSTTVLKSNGIGGEVWERVVMPFSDTLDAVDISKIDAGLAGVNLRPSTLDAVMSKFRTYGTEITKANTTERFISSLVGKTGISVNRARKILARVNTAAAARDLKPQSMFLERSVIEEAFMKEGGMTQAELSKLVESGSDPLKEIIHAAAGDYRVAGLTSGFTGRVKAIAPAIVVWTDRVWPETRWGRLNPTFNLISERIETQFQLIANNIRKEVSDKFLDENRGSILSRGYQSRFSNNVEFADGFIHRTRRQLESTLPMVESAPGFRNTTARVMQDLRRELKRSVSIDHQLIVKQAARDMMGDRVSTSELLNMLHEVRPDILNELALHYKVTKASDVLELVLGEYIMQSEPLLMAEHIARNAGVARTLTGKAIVDSIAESLVNTRGISKAAALEEATAISSRVADMVVGAYEVAIERGMRAADKAQYFSGYRSWFERSINHPLMALYPYSYMTQKAIPSMMKIMFLTPGPGGIILPGFGYSKYQQILEYMNNQLNGNQDVVSQLLQSEPLMQGLGALLPTSSESMGFSQSAIFRTALAQPGLEGTPLTLGAFSGTVSRSARDQFWNGTAAGQIDRYSQNIQRVQDITGVNQGISNIIQSAPELVPQTIRDQIETITKP